MTAQAGDTFSYSDAAAQRRLLRTQLRRLRAQLPQSQRSLAALRAARHAMQWRALRRARHIAVYLHAGSELRTHRLITALQRGGHAVYVPLVDARRRMRFVQLRPGARLRSDALGLRVPAQQRPLRTARQLQAVIAPLVGYTAQGARLGAGGGYYDRSFAFRIGTAGLPRLYGCGYALQAVPTLHSEPWDVPMDALFGDFSVRRCRR